MQYIGVFVLLFLQNIFIFAQKQENLIPNGSFEVYQECPDEYGWFRIGGVAHWKATPPDCTPDYFHECSSKFSPQNNTCGKIIPQEGKGFLGLIIRVGHSPIQSTDELFYREHVQVRLKEPLKHRNRYIFTMHLSLAEYACYAVSKIGVLFTKNPILINDKFSAKPQIELNFIDTKGSWVKVTDTLVAEGGEEYLTLGEFASFSKKDIRKVDENPAYEKMFSYHRAYYFFDNLSLHWLDVLPEPLLGEPPIPPFKLTAPAFTGIEKPWQLEPTEFGYLEPNKPIVLNNVLFEFGKSVLLEESKYELNKLVRIMNEFKDIHIVISGHTDEIGEPMKNLKLSEDRAKAVYDYLISQGITEKRLYYTGYGSSKPLSSNKTAEGRKKNRRVEFYVVGDE
ncbi:OmpA family protein [Raineya orbicola]|jgi:hypothetical protein|uniref:OmpA family n=1 Tax=Raineya orbicola TaxID=2016530 RepID=A0A2N3I959_9BACT|nr:OmpA family protein [Raineya orbicola]PKQ66872.1 OmpA family [Raineya orbicola]